MLPPCKENRVIALLDAETLDCESRIERQSESGLGLRLIELAEIRKRGGEEEMRQRKSPVDVDTLAELRDALLVGAKLLLGAACELKPEPSRFVARGEAKGLVYVAFGLFGAAG